MDQGSSIEVVRGRLAGEDAEQVLAFWAEHAGLSGQQAQERLAQVVCLLRGDDGALTGINSAFQQAVKLIGGRTFWVYRSLLLPEAGDDDWERLLCACYDELLREFDPSGPIGVFVPVDRAGLTDRRPEAIWPQSDFAHAGFLPDGRQARVRYFPEGRV